MTLGPKPVVIALGSNLGDRHYELRRAIHELGSIVRIVRASPVIETAPVDAPSGSGDFLNMVLTGWTKLEPGPLLGALHEIEKGRRRARRVRNAPRRIDLDLILYGAHLIRTAQLQVPHPRFRERGFVMMPLRALNLPWVDPVSGRSLGRLRAPQPGLEI